MIVPIVLCVNDKGIRFINPLIRSIRENASNSVIHLITDSDRDTLPVDYRYQYESPVEDNPGNRYTNYMWVRCYIDQIIPSLKKFVYLDFDCIVMDDLSEMITGDDWVAKAVKYPSGGNFCSGVMSFNFDNPKTVELMQLVRSYINPANHDEEILNVILKRYLTWMPSEYMVMDLGALAKRTVIPKVIHFCGPIKAWNHPLQYYFKYCDLSEDITDLSRS